MERSTVSSVRAGTGLRRAGGSPWRALAPALFAALLLWASPAQGVSERFRAGWRDDPATTMVIGWDQVSGAHPKLYVDTRSHGARHKAYARVHPPDRVVAFRGMNNHFVRLTGLLPDTEYHFIVVDSEGSSRPMSFRTAPGDPRQRLSVIAGGDSRNHREARRSANALVARIRPHFVMFGGDFTGGDTAGEWLDWMDDWQATIGPDGRLTPIVPARGNHEYSNETLWKLFDLPAESGYFALSFGGDLLRLYTLNSLVPAGGDQRDWLEADLAAHAHYHWRIAQYHHSMRPHTYNKREQIALHQHWAWLFFRYGVRLVVESDSHVVKATWPIRPSHGPDSHEGFTSDLEQGTVYLGEGCWGAPLRPNNDDKPWTRASASFHQFKWIVVGLEGIEARTVPTDPFGEVAQNTDDSRFTPPEGLVFWSARNGEVVRIPPATQRYPLPPVRPPRALRPAVAEGGGQAPAMDLPAGPTAPFDPDLRVRRVPEGLMRVSFRLYRPGEVTLRLLGPEAEPFREEAFGILTPGEHARTFDCSSLAPGPYEVVLAVEDEVIHRAPFSW